MWLIGTTVAVVVNHGVQCLLEPATGMLVAEDELVAPAEPRFSMITKTNPGGTQPRTAPEAHRGEAVLRPR